MTLQNMVSGVETDVKRAIALLSVLAAMAMVASLIVAAARVVAVLGAATVRSSAPAPTSPLALPPALGVGSGTTISGALGTSDTWGPGLVIVTGDILINPGVVIEIAPGTTIQIATRDGANLGVDPNRIEYMVGGTLRANGPVTFTSQAVPPDCGDWYGIRFLPSSAGYLRDALVEWGAHAVEINTAEPITIADSTLRLNCHRPPTGDAWGAGLTILGGDHHVTNTRIYSNTLWATGWSNDAIGAGVWLAAGSTLFEDCLVYDNVAQSTGHDGFGGGIALWGGGKPTLHNCEIRDNTITASLHAFGGGVNIDSTDAAIEADTSINDNVITATSGAAYGGGVSISSQERISTPVIRDSRVTANSCFAQSSVGCYGGGIGFVFTPPHGGQTEAVITNSLIAHNTNMGQIANGGGIGMEGRTSADRFDGNVIHDNLAQASSGRACGGGVCLVSANAIHVINNLLHNNQVRAPGGGFGGGGGAYANGPESYLVNNTITSNAAVDGGGLYLAAGVLQNTIVVDNNASHDGGGVYWHGGSAGHNDVWGNTPNDYASSGTPHPGTDIAANPLFTGKQPEVTKLSFAPTDDWRELAAFYHLRQGSPCVDAGTGPGGEPPEEWVPNHDYDGQARPQGATWDIGFDEVQGFQLQKRVSATGLRPGNLLSYTIVLTNPSDVASVRSGWIRDEIPPHTTWHSGPYCTPPRGWESACGYSADLVWWHGDVPPSTTMTLIYTVTVGYGQKITNAAYYAVGAMDGWSNVVATTLHNPIFALRKEEEGGLGTDGGRIAGVPFTYTVIVTNSSPSVAGSGVVVTDAVPPGSHWVTGGSYNNGIVTLVFPTLPPEGQAAASWVVSTCQTGLTNQWYRVATSTMHVVSDWGPPLTTDLSAPALVPTFTQSSRALTAGEMVTFTDRSTFEAMPLVAHGWDFGDGELGSGTVITHTYNEVASYTVTLTITDGCGFNETVGMPDAIIVSPPPVCSAVTGLELTKPASGDIYVGDAVQFSVDISPDNAQKRYSFRITFDGTLGFVLTSGKDPLVFRQHFATAGIHSIKIAVWNCRMTEAEAVTDRVTVKVMPRPPIYLPIIFKNRT